MNIGESCIYLHGNDCVYGEVIDTNAGRYMD